MAPLANNEVDEESFYEKYLVNFLQSGGNVNHYIGPTVNSLWIVEIETTAAELLAISNLGAEVGNWMSKQGQSTQMFTDTAAIAAKYAEPSPVNGYRPVYVVQSVGVPGESNSVNYPETVKFGSGLEGANVGKRGQMKEVSMNFLLTDYSFVDLILRPWSIAISHYGAKLQGLRKNITCILFTRREGARETFSVLTGGTQWRARQKFVFHGAYPVDIGATEFNYKGSDMDKTTTVRFVHDYYSIEALFSPGGYTKGPDASVNTRRIMYDIAYPDRADIFTMDRPTFYTGVSLESYKPIAVGPSFIRRAANMVAKASQMASQYLGAATTSKLGLAKANTIINVGKRLSNSEDQDAELNPSSRLYKGQTGHGYVWRSNGGALASVPAGGLLSKTWAKVSGEGDRTIHTHILDEALALAARALEKSLGATNYDTSNGVDTTGVGVGGNDTPGLESVKLTRINGRDTVSYPIPRGNSINISENDVSLGAGVVVNDLEIDRNDTPRNLKTSADLVKINENDRPLAKQLMVNSVPVNKNDVVDVQRTQFDGVNCSKDDESSGDGTVALVDSDRNDTRNGESVGYSRRRGDTDDESSGGLGGGSHVVVPRNDFSTGRTVLSKPVSIVQNDTADGEHASIRKVAISKDDVSVGGRVRSIVAISKDDDSHGSSVLGGMVEISKRDISDPRTNVGKRVSIESNDHTIARDVNSSRVAVSANDVVGSGNASSSGTSRRIIRVDLDDQSKHGDGPHVVHNRDVQVPNTLKNGETAVGGKRFGPVETEMTGYTPVNLSTGGKDPLTYKQIDGKKTASDVSATYSLSQYKEVVTRHTQAILDRAKDRAR